MAERLVIITPYEDRFLTIGSDITDLIYNEYFVTRENGSGTRLWYEECLKNIGINPNKLKISAQLNNTQSLIHAVANGLGISIVSELAVQHYISQKRIIALDIQNLPKRHFYVVLNKNRVQTPIVDTFVEFVHSYSRSTQRTFTI